MINTINLPPFKKMCVTIGNLPSSFMESMSYYETLCWLYEYLDKTVIPAINTEGEAITELQTAFVTLKNYIDNYFENLDVQEEINTKLDEMAESGELTDIIAQYLEIASILVYNDISEMKNAENLINGSTAKTLGYHTINDGGMSTYKIRTITNEDIVDERNIIALHDETLVAEIITDKKINVKQMGAYGDSTHDDTESIQAAIDSYSEIFIPDGTYMIDASISLIIGNNKTIKLSKNAILKAITNNLESYKIIKIDNVSNIYIEGGIIQGERDTHTGLTGEWGLGISIMNGAKNIIIKNITLKDCWGDGLYINNGENISTENIICDNNRRQGLSIMVLILNLTVIVI